MAKNEVENSSRRKYPSRVWAKRLSSIATIVVLGSVMDICRSNMVLAAEKEVSRIQDFVMGEVTGKRENVIRIDTREYPFFADVIVKDQNLTPMAIKDVVPGIQVLFHLKQGRIDQIIILLPS